VFRVDDLVKNGAKRRRLRRSMILDKIIKHEQFSIQAIKAVLRSVQTCWFYAVADGRLADYDRH